MSEWDIDNEAYMMTPLFVFIIWDILAGFLNQCCETSAFVWCDSPGTISS